METSTKDFWENRLAEDWTETGVGYRALGAAFNTWMYRVRRAVFLREMAAAPIDLPTAEVFDIGSGTGFYVDLWRELGVAGVTGSDITTAAVNNLRGRFPDSDFHPFDAASPELPVPAGAYDIVSAMDMLFHITDDAGHAQALRNAARLLRPGGLFVFSENFLFGPEQRGPRQVNRSMHTIERELAAAGLEPIRHTPMFVLMNAQVDAPWLRRRAWALVMRTVTAAGLGGLAGRLLYPLEMRLLASRREGPSTELMICRRIEQQ
ncbi:class I SAM-dependent methyltransferase [Brevibacterium sp. NPDC049920]|uniref:Methyltransferase type 11 domain-containing protein n=1 Tax=Brevibacterium pityocampae TaxID=506594 RepID=A0ABP8JDT8_9MICO|nr:class I SAM-dependent methyltransferase [uncultured Brevibacterium sp.]